MRGLATSQKVRKVFLTPQTDPNLMSLVCVTEYFAMTNKVQAEFTIRFKTSVVCIHSLDRDKRQEIPDYIVKIDKVISAANDFMKNLKSNEPVYYRDWLNPLESGATGSIAYCTDPFQRYFEIASCEDKIRLFVFSFKRKSTMQAMLKKLIKYLKLHKQDIESYRPTK